MSALSRMSDTFFCATVKSACPTASTPAAVVRTLSVTMPSATTVITPIAMAKAVNADLTRLTRTSWKISQMKDTRPRLLPPGSICSVQVAGFVEAAAAVRRPATSTSTSG